MKHQDTVRLLKECDAGSKMAVSSIDDVLEHVKAPHLRQLLQETKCTHGQLGNRIHSMLLEYDSEEKEPPAMAKTMSAMMSAVKLGLDDTDAKVADLITDGCDMGIKSLCRYRNQYPAAHEDAVRLCDQLIEIEEKLRQGMRQYL